MYIHLQCVYIYICNKPIFTLYTYIDRQNDMSRNMYLFHIMLDVWNEMEQWYQEDISKKRWYQAQLNGGPDPADAANLSVSVDWKVLRE